MSREKKRVGIGIITCNRLDYLYSLVESLKMCDEIYDELVIINDGADKPDWKLHQGKWVDNDNNIGIGKSKNKAMKILIDSGCDYIFIIEDDVVIKNKNVFNAYINASQETGIQHFNYGPGSPFNRKQDINNYDLHNRHLLSTESKPIPKATIQYKNNIKIDLYEHVAGVFSFFTRKILEEVGLNDEQFYNAWEHVDHTYRIILHKGHPPFWWFADIHNSVEYLTIPIDSINKSSTSTNREEWFQNISNGREIYYKKHGMYPNTTPLQNKDTVLKSLKEIREAWKI